MKNPKKIYLIGSLANPDIPFLGNELRNLGFEVFDQWWAPGFFADSYWRKYTKLRGLDFREALKDYAATHIFEFDKKHLDRCDIGVLVMPAGKSGHLEAGYLVGKGKPVYILFENGYPRRYDVMYQFCKEIFPSRTELFEQLKKEQG